MGGGSVTCNTGNPPVTELRSQAEDATGKVEFGLEVIKRWHGGDTSLTAEEKFLARDALLIAVGALEWLQGVEAALRGIAEFPEPLKNKNSALNQCAWLKRIASEALDGE